MNTVQFSIIIPTYKRRDDLFLCLKCLAHYLDPEQEFPFGVEVLISDDARDAALKKEITERFPWATHLDGPSRGPAANRNNAARYAKGDWLVFTDDDCQPQQGWLEAYHKHIDEADVLEGKTVADRPKQRMDEESPINETGGYLWSCNFAIKKSLFDEMGGFCETFPYAAMEDVELRIRLIKANKPFPFIDKALVVHPWRPIKDARFVEQSLESSAHFYKLHPDMRPPSLFKYRWSLFIRCLLKQTLPEMIHYRMRGAKTVFARHGMFLKREMRLMLRKFWLQ